MTKGFDKKGHHEGTGRDSGKAGTGRGVRKGLDRKVHICTIMKGCEEGLKQEMHGGAEEGRK